MSSNDQEKFLAIKAKFDAGEELQSKERVFYNRMKNTLRAKNKPETTVEPESRVRVNTFGSAQSNEVKPKLIRFVSNERAALRSRKDQLISNSAQDIVQVLGSVKAASEDLLVRAAVLSLRDLNDQQLLDLLKEAQINAAFTN
jgi:hypothetical protein